MTGVSRPFRQLRAADALFTALPVSYRRAVITASGDGHRTAERGQQWAEVATDLAARLLAGLDPEAALRLLAAQVRELTGADVAVVVSPSVDDPEDLIITAAEGSGVDDIEGVRIPLPGTVLGDTYKSGAFRVFDDITVLPVAGERAAVVVELTETYGPAMFAPLGELPGRRLLAVLRVAGSQPFDVAEPARLAACAARCATLLDLARAQERSRRLQVQADRDRIARDLHDHVVQRIFAIGLSLDRISRSLEPEQPEAAARVSRSVDELDGTIAGDPRRRSSSCTAGRRPRGRRRRATG